MTPSGRLWRSALVCLAWGLVLGAARAQDAEESAISALASEVSAGAAQPPAKEPPAEAGDPAARRLGLTLSSDAPLEIDSRLFDIVDAPDGGEYLRFNGDVRLTQGALRLTCENLDAYYPEGAEGTPQKVVAEGNVIVRQGDVELRCTRAVFDESSCITICTSSVPCESELWPEQPARLQRGQDSIEGRRLEFNMCTGKLTGRCGARITLKPRNTEAETSAADAP